MVNKAKFQAIKGTRDLLPPETELWARVEAIAREVFGTYRFGEIRPPIFEPTELFARAVGGETDIVSKEMYTFEDRPFALERPQSVDEYEDFIGKIKALMDRGEIPSDGDNTLALKTLEQS